MRILVVRLGAFGDIIHTLPLLADLTRAGHCVHWLCESHWACLLRGNPACSQVHALPRRANAAQVRAMVQELRSCRFAAAIDAQGLAKSALWLYRSGAPIRIGFRPPRSREGAHFLANRRLCALGVHVIDQQRSLARGLGVSNLGPPRFPLPAWDDEHAWATGWLAEQGLVLPLALNVGAGWPSKVWPVAYQQEWLAGAVAAGQRPVVIWGSGPERAVAEQLVAAVPGSVLAPATTLPQLAALLHGCGVLVSGDTGPLHLAAAVGCPTVGLFGPVPHQRNGPRGPSHPNLQAKAPLWERRRAELVDWSALDGGRVLALAQSLCRQVAAG